MNTIATKERPILFSGPMVSAILDGRKTQTRRIVKPQDSIHEADGGVFYWIPPGEHEPNCQPVFAEDRCPYGEPGDRLWVRETWSTGKTVDSKSPAAIADSCLDAGYSRTWAPIKYDADGATRDGHYIDNDWGGWGKTRVSIHMPRWASRITLEITSVRVERLQEISEADALAEGFSSDSHRESCMTPEGFVRCDWPQWCFRRLWHELNGRESWDANPWVWVIGFKRIEAPA